MYATQHLFQNVPFHGSYRYKPKQNVVRPIFRQLGKIYMCAHLSIVVPIFRRTCINENILSSIELCTFCRVVRMVEMSFEVICSVDIEVTKYNMTIQ